MDTPADAEEGRKRGLCSSASSAQTLDLVLNWRFRQLLEALPAAVYTTDAEGRITFYNQAAVEFSGRGPELGSDRWCVSSRLYAADGEPMPP